MKFKSGIIADGRGSIGGITLSRNSFGNFFRARSKPCRSSSNAASARRAGVGALHGYWRALTPSQQEGWLAAATFIDSQDGSSRHRYGTGQNYFIAYNTHLLMRSEAWEPLRIPPEWPRRAAAPTVEVTASYVDSVGTPVFAGTVFNMDSPQESSGLDFWHAFISYPLPRARNTQPRRWCYFSLLEIPSVGSGPQNFYLEGPSIFGTHGEHRGAIKWQAVWYAGWFSPAVVIMRDMPPEE